VTYYIKDITALTNEELVTYVTNLERVTTVELELLIRLEQYVTLYGDYLQEIQH